MTRVLVTGASGFIGRAAVAALAQNGCAVRAALRRLPEPAFPPGIEVMQHPDLSQSFDWRPLLDGIDRVIHLAGIAHTGRGVAPEFYDRINCAATARACSRGRRSRREAFRADLIDPRAERTGRGTCLDRTR